MKKLLFVLLCIGGTIVQAAEEATVKYVLFETTDNPRKEIEKDTYSVEIEFPAGTGRSPITIQLGGPGSTGELTKFVSVEVQEDWLHRVRPGKGYIKGITIEGQELGSDEIAVINSAIDQYKVNASTGRPDTGKPMLTFIVKEVGGQYSISAYMGNPTKKS